MAKVYLAQLERFGYLITAVGRTKGEAHQAIMETYKSSYRHENGTEPSMDRVPYSDRTFLQLAEEELFVTEIRYGEALWL